MARTPEETREMEEMLKEYFARGGVIKKLKMGERALPPMFVLSGARRRQLIEDGSKKRSKFNAAEFAQKKRDKLNGILKDIGVPPLANTRAVRTKHRKSRKKN